MEDLFNTLASTNQQVNIAGVVMTKKIGRMLTDFDTDTLDSYEAMQYQDFKGNGKETALQIIINTVEGDYSQLSEGLAEIAELQLPTEY